MSKPLEETLDKILLEYANSNPKRKIGILPRLLSKILAALPLEVLLEVVKAKTKK